MKAYNKPEFYVTEFVPNAYVAGCDLNIVSGTNTVKIYCVKTSYVTVFTSTLDCAYQRDAFTSTSAAKSFFSQLFQWGDGVAEGGNVTNNTTSLGWTQDQKNTANSEINNGRTLLTGTEDLGGYGNNSKVHAGYALDYLNGFKEGKALS
ncbi:MAG: hypothetical protein ACI4MP_08165 [Candidatus Ventricola sp.]